MHRWFVLHKSCFLFHRAAESHVLYATSDTPASFLISHFLTLKYYWGAGKLKPLLTKFEKEENTGHVEFRMHQQKTDTELGAEVPPGGAVHQWQRHGRKVYHLTCVCFSLQSALQLWMAGWSEYWETMRVVGRFIVTIFNAQKRNYGTVHG